MELIDIIKSTILLFSLLLLTIVFISFGLFKIRNQAKEKGLKEQKPLEKKILPIKARKAKKLNISKEESHSKEKYLVEENFRDNEKFVVINNNLKPTPFRNFRVNYQPNVYKFYDDLNSKSKFKIKPETSAHS